MCGLRTHFADPPVDLSHLRRHALQGRVAQGVPRTVEGRAMRLISVDASKRSIPWALWQEGLWACGLERASRSLPWPEALYQSARALRHRLRSPFDLDEYRAVVELPRIYPGSRSGRPNDLVDLAAAAGIIGAVFGPVEFVHPRTWKGTVPKEVMTRRILTRLTDEEHKVHDRYEAARPRAKKPDHNVLDAIGVGLWKRGRL